jgi:Putative transposase
MSKTCSVFCAGSRTQALAEAHAAGQLAFFGEIDGLRRREAFVAHLAPLKRKDWFVYAKPPFAGPAAVLAYLARYTHRVAISNSRLVSLDARGVTFRYKDYRRNGRARFGTMTLMPTEFIRRFLLHVLPKGFHRVRHYGLLASATCKANVARAKQLMPAPLTSIDPSTEHDDPDVVTGATADHRPPCPCCGGAHDHCRELRARRRTPRPAITPTQHRQRNAMTPVTISAHKPPAGNHACGAASLSPHRLQRHTAHRRPRQNRPATTAPATKSLLPSSCCHRPRQSTHPRPSRRTVKSPESLTANPAARGVPSWEAFGRRPSERARPATTGPASETLHQKRTLCALGRGRASAARRGARGNSVFNG